MSEDFNSFPSRLTQTALSNISEILKRTRDATNRSAEPIIKQENQKNIERLVSDMRQISVPDMSYLKSGHRDLVIVGNGFDLACGLKSRFSDFIEASEKDDDISIADNAITRKHVAGVHSCFSVHSPRVSWLLHCCRVLLIGLLFLLCC